MLSLYSQPPEVIKKCLDHPALRCYVHDQYKLPLYEAFKLFIFPGPIIFFIRILSMYLLYSLQFVFQTLVFLGYKDWDKPAPRWRRNASQIVMKHFCRACFFAGGFYWIKYVDHSKDRPKSKNWEDQPRFNWLEDKYPLVGNHCTFIDVLSVCMCLGAPSFMTKNGVTKDVMARFLSKAFRYILVYRKTDTKPKDYSPQQEIINRVNEAYDMKHANDTPYAPLVFPEGTTSSGKQVTRFHRGVFVAGKPIRPFTINYPSQHFSNNYDAVSTIRLAYGILTQFYNKFEMHVYDLYIPNEQERNNPDLYAENVGKFIAGKLNKPYVDQADLRTSDLVCHILVDNKYRPEEIDDEIAKLDQIKSQERQIHNDKIAQSKENTEQPNILLQD